MFREHELRSPPGMKTARGDFGRGDESYSERLELLRAHREAVVAQMAEMSSSLAAIDYKIDLYTKEVQQ